MEETNKFAELGPNMKKLVSIKMAHDAIPPNGGLEDGLRFLVDGKTIAAGFGLAAEFVKMTIDTVRKAGEPNPWRIASDEAIAGYILQLVEQRNANRRKCNA